jgi:hypothetical protein
MQPILTATTGTRTSPAPSGYRVDVSRGERIGRVSSEWFSRPADERFLSLNDLHRTVKARADRSGARTLESREVRVEAARDNPERLSLILPGEPQPVAPTHWSFGQLASLVGAPAGYLRGLPAPIAGINLQYGLTHHRAEMVKAYTSEARRTELRAVTGPDYGRIHDHELVEAVMRMAGNGTGDTRWKVPGVLDWRTMRHNPHVDITAETTTLYASDRDVFVFLCDDANPIEAGRLPDSSPDLYFRGFYCWNSEVGARTLGIASFYLRAVCANRNLWGVEQFEELTIRHSKYAASRFALEAAPALESFADSSAAGFISGIRAARAAIVARTDEDRADFLRKRGFSKADTATIIETVLNEEGHPPSSVFDFVQGITAMARGETRQDARLEVEMKAKRLMDQVTA